MVTQNQIGLSNVQSKEVADRLNILLSNYQVFYINARGFHWNITGEKFFELHAKFEELYNDLLVKVDEIAERILTLGHVPLHTFSDYTAVATIKEAKNISDGKEAMQNILISFRTLIQLQREISAIASEADDEGTNALMSDYIREQEKLTWMYSAYLK
ncbi:MAG TPA: Dps family protein [Flavisolibacter sp.]|nr:Dps family protein [Flavisolibacter sp.]